MLPPEPCVDYNEDTISMWPWTCWPLVSSSLLGDVPATQDRASLEAALITLSRGASRRWAWVSRVVFSIVLPVWYSDKGSSSTTFTFVCVMCSILPLLAYWHINIRHVHITCLWLDFHIGRWRWSWWSYSWAGCQASDCSSRLDFNIWKHGTTENCIATSEHL